MSNSEGELYQSLPAGIEIRVSRSSGRGIWTKQSLKAGTTIIAAKPHVAVLSTGYLDTYCSACFSPKPMKRCPSCRLLQYCDPACQKIDWNIHKLECPALQKWSQMAPTPDLAVPDDAVRCLGRVIWKKQKKGPEHTWTKEMDAMQSHRASLKPGDSTTGLLTRLAHCLVQYLGAGSAADLQHFGISSSRVLVDLISQFTTNTFSLTDPSLTPIGATVSPLIALINHSCSPNAVVVFPRHGPTMQVIALRDINGEEEILTSYIDVTLPRDRRQKDLIETYNFECRCELCTHPPPVDLREALWCPKACGGICPIPTEDNVLSRCINCKAVLVDTDAAIDAVRIGQEALDKATAAKQLTSKLIPILISAGLTPSSHPLLALCSLHQSLLVHSFPEPLTQDHLNETIRASTRYTTGLRTLLGPGHPVLGVAEAEMGKLLAVDEPEPKEDGTNREYPPSGLPRLRLAQETLIQARNTLLIGFGEQNQGGEVGVQVRETLVHIEKEIQVWKQGVRNVMNDRPK
ncbi:hypothetical protein C8J56DRAFT_1001009 [Mycena floridula]|nr:hypothetical protein C8J56DRAFT_1001009 [Mycena floridula]